MREFGGCIIIRFKPHSLVDFLLASTLFAFTLKNLFYKEAGQFGKKINYTRGPSALQNRLVCDCSFCILAYSLYIYRTRSQSSTLDVPYLNY